MEASTVTLVCEAWPHCCFLQCSSTLGVTLVARLASRRLSSCRGTGSEGAGLASLAVAAFGVDLELRACLSPWRSPSSYLTWVAT